MLLLKPTEPNVSIYIYIIHWMVRGTKLDPNKNALLDLQAASTLTTTTTTKTTTTTTTTTTPTATATATATTTT